MTRNLRHDLKRVAAGVCALMLVSGTVPVKPIAEVINTAIMASAEGSGTTNVYDFTFDEYTGSAEAVDLNTIIKADEDDVKNWIIDNGSAISESNTNFEGNYVFCFYEMFDEEPVLCSLIVHSSDIGNADTLDTMFNSSSDYQAYQYSSEDEALSDLGFFCDDSFHKVYFAAAAQNTSTEQGAGFTQINSPDELNADLPEISHNDAKAWVKAHIDEIKALDPDYKNYYDFVYKYNGDYYLTCIDYQSFNTDDLEGYWGDRLLPHSLDDCKYFVSFWKSQNQLVFLWQGESASESEEQNAPVSYMTWDDTEKKLVEQTDDNACKEYTEVTAETTAFEDGKWYVVNADTTISNRITVTGTAHLILADGKTLTASKGIEVSAGNTLNIYAQSEGDTAGILLANANELNAAIGGGTIDSGTVTVNGGTVTATGGKYAAGIGGGHYGAGGTVTVNGGTVTANGGHEGAGIGSGNNYDSGSARSGGTVTINGGTVTATGGKYAAGIGGGDSSSGATVTINGGTVTATGGEYAVGIGAGADINDHGSLTVADTHGVFGGESEDPTDIHTDYASTRWLYMIVKEVPHSHDFSYSADGATITATCNGKGVGDCDITDGLTLTINAPTGDLTYDGTAKEATLSTVILGEVFSGYNGTVFPGTLTIEYYKDEAKLDGAPVNAGDYTAKVTVGDATAVIDFTIAKADPTVTAPTAKTDLIYTGEDQALIEKGSTTGGTIQYSLDGVDFSTEIPEGKNAGNYTVYYKVIGDDNYNSTNVKTVDVTIARADLPVTVTGYEGTFDGNPHGISVDIGNSDAVVYYARESLNADNYEELGSTVNPSFTNAGTYRVYYYVTTGNYDPNPVSGDKLVTIKKADAPALTDDQKPTPVDKLVYTGEALDLVTAPENIPNGYSIRYSINGGAWISTLPTAIESGTYTVAYKYVENTNYKDIAGETFTITVKDKYSEPMWVWADDYSSATATFIKNDNSSEPIILDAEVTSEVVSEPTYTEYGKTVYIATVKLEGKTYTYRKPVITAKLALTHVEAVPATCDAAGNIEYWFDAENEKYFADAKGETEITKDDTIVAPIDHTYGEPQWIWNAENAATATFKCAECGDEQTINAVVTAEVTAPTYTKNGKTVYTATVNFEGETYTDTLTVTIGKKAYTAPTISYLKGDGAVKLSWNAIEGAERYAIAGFIDGKWKLLNRTEDTSFIIDNLNPGEQYKVAVVAMFDGEYIMDFSNAIVVTPKPAQEVVYPKITEIEYNEQYHQFKLNWTEVPNAQNYGIAVYLAGKWKIQTQSIPATTTSFTSPKLKAGQTYKMIVCAKVNGKWDLSALNSRAFSVTVK